MQCGIGTGYVMYNGGLVRGLNVPRRERHVAAVARSRTTAAGLRAKCRRIDHIGRIACPRSCFATPVIYITNRGEEALGEIIIYRLCE